MEAFSYHDIYAVDLRSGKKRLIIENRYFGGFMFDNNMLPRLGYNETEDGGTVYFKAIWSTDGDKIVKWEMYRSLTIEDSVTTFPKGFDKSNKNVYWIDATKNDLGKSYAYLKNVNISWFMLLL